MMETWKFQRSSLNSAKGRGKKLWAMILKAQLVSCILNLILIPWLHHFLLFKSILFINSVIILRSGKHFSYSAALLKHFLFVYKNWHHLSPKKESSFLKKISVANSTTLSIMLPISYNFFSFKLHSESFKALKY